MLSFRAGDGAEIAYVQTGSGTPALVFAHGWQSDHSVWRDVIGALGPGMRSVAVDLRGAGASASAGGPHRLERYAADVRELSGALDIAPAVVIGHSMGATVALRLALDAPGAVRALVLVAPVPASGGDYSPKGEAFLRATPGDPAATRNWLARTLVPPADETMLERLCAAAARTPRDAALESFNSWAFADFAEATRSIDVPVLVVAPESDSPNVVQSMVAGLLPNARCVVLERAAHYAIVEQPLAIAELIREFVA
jgi:pimeloyl-ACP methyl ester carboxylesterase